MAISDLAIRQAEAALAKMSQAIIDLGDLTDSQTLEGDKLLGIAFDSGISAIVNGLMSIACAIQELQGGRT